MRLTVGALVVALFSIGFVSDAGAQAPDSVKLPHWVMDLTGKFSASQAGYHNWTEGGVNSLASAALITGKFERTSRDWLQTYEARLGIGVVKQDTLDFRKADDIIRLRSQISYQGNGLFRKFNPTAAADVRTQFAPGFAYDKNPFPENDGDLPVKVSDFFAPATFSQSLGLSYDADWGFSQRLGIGAKETIVVIDRLQQLYGQDATARFQLGAESQTQIDKEVFDNITYKSTLALFAAFNREELPDMLWENIVVMKVNSWLSADFEFVTLYDRDINDVVQIKEVLSVGVSFVFI